MVKRIAILMIITLSFLTEKYSQCQDFSIYYEASPICSGSLLYLNSQYYTSTGASSSDTSFTWYINDLVVSDLDLFNVILNNFTNNDSVFKVSFKGEAVGSGCSFDSTFYITVYPEPSIETIPKNVSCPSITGATGDGEIMVQTNSSSFTTHYSSGGTNLGPPNNNDTIKYLTAGTYDVYVMDNITGCISITSSETITEPNPFEVTDTIIQHDNCGQGTGVILFRGLNGGTRPYSFSNEVVNGTNTTEYELSNNNDSIIKDLSGGLYTIIIKDTNDCEYYPFTNQITINSLTNSPPLDPDYTNPINLCAGETLILQDTVANNEDLFHIYIFSSVLGNTYSTGSTLEYPNFIDFPQEIKVFVKGKIGDSNQGCNSGFVTVYVEEKEDCENSENPTLITTNAFKPNDSNPDNAVFKIDLDIINNGTENNLVTIFNKWGDIVFKKMNYNNKDVVWNGDNLKGDSLAEGTYFYTIEVQSKNFTTSGWVYLDK